MKNILGLFILVLALASCQKEAVDNKAVNQVRIIGQQVSDDPLRTAFINPGVNWVAGDQIGVFSDRATVSGGGKAINVPYTAQQSNTSTSTFTSTTPIYFDGTFNPHDFSAIYPYKESNPWPTDAWTAVPISLPDVQTQAAGSPTAHIPALDVMIAKTTLPVTVESPTPTLTFTFHHVFSILKFNVTCATAHTLKEIKATDNDGRILSVAATNTINIGQDLPVVGPGNLAGAYYLNTPAVPAGGTPTVTLNTDLPISLSPASAYMVVFPQAFTGTFTITFKNELGTVYTLTKTSITLERGKVYDVNVLIPSGGTPNTWE
jgi:hypothetical protein